MWKLAKATWYFTLGLVSPKIEQFFLHLIKVLHSGDLALLANDEVLWGLAHEIRSSSPLYCADTAFPREHTLARKLLKEKIAAYRESPASHSKDSIQSQNEVVHNAIVVSDDEDTPLDLESSSPNTSRTASWMPTIFRAKTRSKATQSESSAESSESSLRASPSRDYISELVQFSTHLLTIAQSSNMAGISFVFTKLFGDKISATQLNSVLDILRLETVSIALQSGM